MAQISLSGPTTFGARRQAGAGSRVVRHEVIALAIGLLRALDIAAVPIAGLIAYVVRYQSLSVEFQHGLIIILGMAVVANVMAIIDAYNLADLRTIRTQLFKVVGAWAVSIALLLAIAFFDKITDQYSRLWIGYWFVLGTTLSGMARVGVGFYIGHRRRTGNLSINVAIVGHEPFAQQVMQQITWPGEIEVRVVGIESEASPSMSAALAAGAIVPIDVEPTVADGLAGNLEPGAVTVDLALEHGVEVLTVSEADIRSAMAFSATKMGLVLEGAGAVGVAALRAGVVQPDAHGKETVVLLTGRNVAPNLLSEVLHS